MKMLTHPDVKQYSSMIRLQWLFNLEKAPWWGGMFERMVKSTKRCLRKAIGRAKLTYDELLTTITEVEMILNSRPLSYMANYDVEEPLTPSHLILGRRVINRHTVSKMMRTSISLRMVYIEECSTFIQS